MSELERLKKENAELRKHYAMSTQYIRAKVNQLLTVMGTAQIRPDELDDATLIDTDPIGIVSNSFKQILKHLNKTNEKLKFANEEIRIIFDSAGIGILVIDDRMRVTAHNRKLKELFVRDKDEIAGMYCFDTVCLLRENIDRCPFKRIFKTGEVVHQSQWALRERFFNVVGTPVKDASGRVTNVVMVYVDITERILADRALRKSEEKYRDLFENANDLIQSVGPDGTMLYVNRAWRETLGYSEQEILGLSVFDIIHPECVTCGPDFKNVVCGEKTGRVETMFITKDCEKIIVEGNISTIVEDGRFQGTRGIFRDITARKHIEETLASEREQLSITLRSIGDGVITTDTSANVVLLNNMAEQLTGWSWQEAFGRPSSEIFNIINAKTRSRTEDPIATTLQTGQKTEISRNTLLIARDGKERAISDSVAPIRDRNSVITGTVVVFRDITERQKMQERIQRSEKIESLGVLAGGIAHDFNNLLNAIMGNIDLVINSTAKGDPRQEALSRAEMATSRAKDLTAQLLTFSKGGAPIKKPGPITNLIQDSVDFTMRGSSVKAEFSIANGLWNVEIDEGQISQVINNLALNAMQAMPEGGRLFISAENFICNDGKSAHLKAGKYVLISIRDTGQGIPKAIIGKVFEPYFTTKATGNGLGLATSYSIVKNHYGMIDVESKPEEGATFHVYLPAYFGLEEVEKLCAVTDNVTVGASKGRILLMDDDSMVRMTAVSMLKHLGFDVLEAQDGNEAIKLYIDARSDGKPFNAVIMDLTIPGGMGGKDAIQKLREIDPEVKAIVSSGYSSDPIMASFEEYGFSGVLLKPYKLKSLNEVVNAIVCMEP